MQGDAHSAECLLQTCSTNLQLDGQQRLFVCARLLDAEDIELPWPNSVTRTGDNLLLGLHNMQLDSFGSQQDSSVLTTLISLADCLRQLATEDAEETLLAV
eukprot:scaffold465044_cov28-Prasinocladus_malaysianus.AAC.1